MLVASPSRSRSAVAALTDVAQRPLELARGDSPLPHVLRGPLPLGAAEALVVGVVQLLLEAGAGSRPRGPAQRLGAVRGAARGEQESGVCVHAVLGAYGEPLQVPGAHERLPGVGLGELPMVAQRLGGPGELGDRCDI